MDEELAVLTFAKLPTPEGALPVEWTMPRHIATQIMEDIEKLGNDASLGSKQLWGVLNTVFQVHEVDHG